MRAVNPLVPLLMVIVLSAPSAAAPREEPTRKPGEGPAREHPDNRPKGFFGVEFGDAKRVAFVCDASGSMIMTFGTLRAELAAAVDLLRPDQSCSILFFCNDDVRAMNDGKMQAATAENKRQAREWLNSIVCGGTSNPVPAVERAFALKPNVVYFLTDGHFPNEDEISTKVAGLNRDRRIRIHTIALVASDDLEKLGEDPFEFLKRLAKKYRGAFKLVVHGHEKQ